MTVQSKTHIKNMFNATSTSREMNDDYYFL